MAGEKILVASGESAIREIVSYNLGRKGYDVTAVEDLQAAQEMIHVDPPDLLILDVLPPGVDSYEFSRQVGADSMIPLILLTVVQEGLGGTLGLNWGADDIVIKPFSSRELASRVRAVLRRKRLAHLSAGGAHLIDNMSNSSSAKRILVVVDEPYTARLIKKKLDLDGYQTLEARDGFQALEKVWRYEPDLVLLDVGMQGQDGLETLEHLRKFSDIPVIMLTGSSDREVHIRGLELDADDYLIKPFSLRALSSRIRAVLRRTQQTVNLPDGDQPRSVGSRLFAIGTRRESAEEEKIAPCPQRILRQLLATYGTGLLNEPARVDAFLADLCGKYRRERFLIVQALRERVPADMLSQPQAVATLRPRLTRRLQERNGLSAESAQWAVECWAMALNIEELLVPSSGVPATEDVPTDRDVLVAFYDATNGRNWSNSQNWLSDGPLDSWHGVATDSNGRVSRLSLLDNGLRGSIPPELGYLSNLEWLGLTNIRSVRVGTEGIGNWDKRNELRGPIPAEICKLSNLEWLCLSGNQLSGSIPPQLANLSNLKSLSLDNNQLNGSIPPQLANLSNLERLSLSGNLLSGPIPPQLANLSNLKSLFLDDNQLNGSIPPQLANLSNLKSLSLDNNQLNGSIPPQLANLSNLKSLSLDNNQLNGSIPPQLADLSNLERLSLSGNLLSGPIPPQLANLSNLKSLSLDDNQLNGSIPPQLANLSNLTHLSLGRNRLIGRIPPQLANLSNLECLFLSNNLLSGPIPPQLSSLARLRVLTLSGNELSGPIPPQPTS